MNHKPSFATENLKNLKSKLESKQMSVLVGAGFGKNIHNMFPSWWELLFDMAYFLNGKEIEKAYLNIPVKKRSPKKKFIDDAIGDFIDSVGYLDLVTQYINRKGFQEAISTYIEDKTPKVIEKDSKRYIVNRCQGKNNEVELTDSMLDLHSSLINLPWNNIYTTNYDEMLELSNDKTNEEKLLLIKKTIEEKNEKLFNDLIHFSTFKIEQEDILNLMEENESLNNVVSNTVSTLTTPIQSSNSEINAKKNEIKQAEYELIRIESSIKQNNIELLKIQKEIEKCLKTVVHSSDLAIKRNRNIIKLHGSIRKDKDPYGFDNDIRSHYVISKEDYDLYPQKHEAFTQLMRISLLQESYCLIGFSGVDPNFLEWIKWVRDVLERNGESKKNYKIYLIEVSKNKGEDEKELFYENFRICKIALDDDLIIQFMEDETGLKLNKKIDRKKALLNLLFSYLKEENFETPDLFIQQYNSSRYANEWSSISTSKIISKAPDEIKILIDEILQHYNVIVENRNCSRIKSNNFIFSRSKVSLLQFSVKLLNDSKSDIIKQKKIFDLILIAIEDLMLPIEGFWNSEEVLFLESFLLTEDEKSRFSFLKLRGLLLYYDKTQFLSLAKKLNNNDILKYEKALFYAFSFDFKSMKLELDSWSPSKAEYILKKSGLIALLDLKSAAEYLSSNKTVFEKSSAEELLFYFQAIIYYDQNLNSVKRNKINSYITILESKGFKGIDKQFKSIVDDLKIKPQKIDRYGAGRFSLFNETILSNDISKRAKSIQFIQLLLELGLPLTGYYALKSAEEWYEVCKIIFEEFPIPCLFYSLQYSTEKVIRRIGQDYAYSDELGDYKKQILRDLLVIYLKDELPWKFKKSILYFCSELFVAVHPKIWESKFLLIWKKSEFQKFSFDDRRNEEYIFVIEAIKIIKNKITFNSIILSCLNNFEKSNSINFLYNIVHNDSFKNINIQNKAISKRINELIFQIEKNENLIFVFGNLNSKLTPLQQLQVKEQLKKIKFKEIKDPGAWRILYYFCKEDLINQFKKGLLDSDLVFNTGFNSPKSLSLGYNFLSLSIFNNDKIWTKSEAKLIYKKMLLELDKIDKWKLRDTDTDFEFMFKEMLSFLEVESNLLNEIRGYKKTKEKIHSYLNLKEDYNTIGNAFISDDKTNIINALSELSNLIEDKISPTEVNENLQLLLNRLLFQNGVALEAILNYIAVWISEESNKDLFLSHKNVLKLILDKYSKDYPKNVEIPFVRKQLVIIGISYLKIFGDDSKVSEFIESFKKKEFFN
ncbi:SIR2-like protein [Flavobacterium sp. 270]|uniref:SIR2 family protein n=1 Tax=Flavobacterium sp. 270 TaxID=2512114 RepID=UPI001065C951|nr:SIR2 family protein [Flavobacterium sp. 270]TDW51839.1 SIR2-like protein [Flavobacterium sp. 270]